MGGIFLAVVLSHRPDAEEVKPLLQTDTLSPVQSQKHGQAIEMEKDSAMEMNSTDTEISREMKEVFGDCLHPRSDRFAEDRTIQRLLQYGCQLYKVTTS